jgi:hypothetical protein
MPTLQRPTSTRAQRRAASRHFLPNFKACSYLASSQSRTRHHRRTGNRRVLAWSEGRMSPAEVARTITSLVHHGTLSTVDTQGCPLGTYITFVLDESGFPLLRLRSDAAHTENLRSNKHCTIFAHPSARPARQLARVTLIGEVEDLSEEEAREAAARHSDIFANAVGVDAPQEDDIFMRLRVNDCFYVAGLGVRYYLPHIF